MVGSPVEPHYDRQELQCVAYSTTLVRLPRRRPMTGSAIQTPMLERAERSWAGSERASITTEEKIRRYGRWIRRRRYGCEHIQAGSATGRAQGCASVVPAVACSGRHGCGRDDCPRHQLIVRGLELEHGHDHRPDLPADCVRRRGLHHRADASREELGSRGPDDTTWRYRDSLIGDRPDLVARRG